MKQFEYKITDPLGMHARPAGLFVKEAINFSSSVELEKNGKKGDGKRIFSVMSLGIKGGEKVTVTIKGEDEEQAARALETFMKENL